MFFLAKCSCIAEVAPQFTRFNLQLVHVTVFLSMKCSQTLELLFHVSVAKHVAAFPSPGPCAVSASASCEKWDVSLWASSDGYSGAEISHWLIPQWTVCPPLRLWRLDEDKFWYAWATCCNPRERHRATSSARHNWVFWCQFIWSGRARTKQCRTVCILVARSLSTWAERCKLLPALVDGAVKEWSTVDGRREIRLCALI